MKPVDVKSNTYIDFDKENNKEDPKFKVADHLWVSKFRNIFAIIYTSKRFSDEKVETTGLWTFAINDLNSDKIVGPFTKKELQK